MKKLSLMAVLVAGLLRVASAQTINISGTVKTSDGDALRLAFVQDKQYKYGAYTDSLGNFALAVNPGSKLKVSCYGFRDTLININNQTTFAIVLRPLVNITANAVSKSNITPNADPNHNINMITMSETTTAVLSNAPDFKRLAFTDPSTRQKVYASENKIDMTQGTLFPVFHHKDETQGSRYLFNDWVHGYVVNAKDSTIQSPALFFNYDKMDGSLLLTQDKHAAIAVYREDVKSFTLFDALNQAYTFTIVPEIDKTHYVQVIASGNNYKIYKTVNTKFIKSNYSSDGIASTGNNFDLYEDEFTYYVLNVKTNQLQKITLKKKALKQAFVADGPKADNYFKTNDGDIDDTYLASLGDYMNK